MTKANYRMHVACGCVKLQSKQTYGIRMTDKNLITTFWLNSADQCQATITNHSLVKTLQPCSCYVRVPITTGVT